MAEIQLRNGCAQTTTEIVPSKRQRRPSVRLADIGQNDNHEPIRRAKQRKQSIKESTTTTKVLKTQTSKNPDVGARDGKEGEKEVNFENLAIGSWRIKDSKSKRGVKRPRTNWTQRVDGELGNNKSSNNSQNNGEEEDDKLSGEFQDKEVEEYVKEGGEEEIEGEYVRDSDMEDEGGPENLVRVQSPVHSVGLLAAITDNERELVQFKSHCIRPHERTSRETKRAGGTNRDHCHERHDDGSGDKIQGVELDGTSGNDCGEENGNNNTSNSNGVKAWLDGLGLGRYLPVFEIHEVDEEVLPSLTSEDLRDMGINAVGSRRKLFCAIQKLGGGFL